MKKLFLLCYFFGTLSCAKQHEEVLSGVFNANFEIVNSKHEFLIQQHNFHQLQISFEENGKEVFLKDIQAFINVYKRLAFKSNNMVTIYTKVPTADFNIFLEGKKIGRLSIESLNSTPYNSPMNFFFNGKILPPPYIDPGIAKGGGVMISINPEHHYTIPIN